MAEDETEDREILEVDVEQMEAAVSGHERQLPDRRVKALTDEEREICVQICRGGGVDYLRYEKRWTAEDIKQFMARVAVQHELDYLRRMYTQREGIQERTLFFAQLQINKMVPAALNVIARSLRGDVMRENGTVDRAPSRSQFDAAMTVLDRANINNAKYKGSDALPSIDARSVKISLGEEGDDVDLSDRESRDKVRSFVSGLLTDLDGNGKKRKRKRNAKKKKKKRSKRTSRRRRKDRDSSEE